jgi:hypothetical protein
MMSGVVVEKAAGALAVAVGGWMRRMLKIWVHPQDTTAKVMVTGSTTSTTKCWG